MHNAVAPVEPGSPGGMNGRGGTSGASGIDFNYGAARDLQPTALGVGLRYDLSDNFHLLGYVAPGVENLAQTARWSWYASVLFTF